MRIVVCIFCILVSGASAWGEASPASAPQSADATLRETLLDGVFLRAEAIFSGQFTVTRTTGIGNSLESRASRGPYIFTRSGRDWARRPTWNSLDRIVNRDQRQMSVWQNGKNPDGSIDTGAQFTPPVPTWRAAGDTSPFFAGTFWLEDMLNYVRTHKADAVYKGTADIEGVKTDVLEWSIPKEDRLEVMKQSNNVIPDHGGFLRIYVAPQWGYVLPRIDRTSPDNVLACRFESKDFREVTSGIWFPFKSTWEWHDKGLQFYEEYAFDRVGLINEAIPDSEFEFSVPVGTRFSDERNSAVPIMFDVKSVSGVERLEQIIQAGRQSAANGAAVDLGRSRWSTSRLALVALNVGGVALLVFRASRFWSSNARQAQNPATVSS